MALTTFTAAQVLTAAQLNAVQANDYNQTVSTKTASYTLVAADKGTRVVMNVASANTVTVNTSLFSAGDTLVIQNIGAGVTTVTAGTATVSSAGPLTIAQYGSGTLYFTSAGVSLWFPSAGPAVTSALTRIGGGSLSGTSVTFSNVFSATYNNYLVKFNSVAVDASTPYLTLKIAATAVHNFMVYETRGSGVGPASANAAEDNAQIYLAILDTSANYITSGHIEICSPFLAARTGVDGTFAAAQNSRMFTTNGVVKNTTSYTAFTIENSSAQTFTGGIVDIYGFSLS